MRNNNNNILKLSFTCILFLLLVSCATTSSESGGGNKPIGRTQSDIEKRQEEITMAIEQGRSITYAIYQSALQRNNELRGRVVFEMIVTPDGAVGDASVISSDINDDAFLSELVVYLKGLQFPPRNIGNFVTTIPIDFDQTM